MDLEKTTAGGAETPACAMPGPDAAQPKIGFTPLDVLAAAVFFAVGWLFWEWQLWGTAPFSSIGV